MLLLLPPRKRPLQRRRPFPLCVPGVGPPYPASALLALAPRLSPAGRAPHRREGGCPQGGPTGRCSITSTATVINTVDANVAGVTQSKRKIVAERERESQKQQGEARVVGIVLAGRYSKNFDRELLERRQSVQQNCTDSEHPQAAAAQLSALANHTRRLWSYKSFVSTVRTDVRDVNSMIIYRSSIKVERACKTQRRPSPTPSNLR